MAVSSFIDFILHIDKHLSSLIQNYGMGTYLILFLIIFLETGFVVTPFLPGDSLLFATGAFAAQGVLNLWLVIILLLIAAIAGDSLNFWIGHHVGKRWLRDGKLINKDYLQHTEEFYKKHGNKTVVLARFLPVIRTFAPFVAGIGRMHYPTFVLYNILGALLWIGLFVISGYLFGNISWVQDNFSLVILTIIILSFVPGVIEYLRHRKKRKIKQALNKSAKTLSEDQL